MVKYIIGEQGSGKTKWLIDDANEEIKNGNGNIVFIDTDDDHIFSLNYNVRLINANEFEIYNVDSFFGFLCGLMGMDYDIEKIYIDSVYKMLKLDVETLEQLNTLLVNYSKKHEVDVYMNVNYTMDDMPEALRACSLQLEK